MLRNLNVLFVLLLITGCAQLGLTSPKTFEDKLAYAYGTHTAVLQAATAGVNGKTLTSTDGEQVLKLADESRQILDAARIANKAGDINTANGKLLLATNILTQLQTYLQSRSKK